MEQSCTNAGNSYPESSTKADHFCCWCQVSPSPSLPFHLPSASLWHIIPLLLALLLRFFNSSQTAVEYEGVKELSDSAYAARGPSQYSRIQLIEKDLGGAVRTMRQVVKAVEKLGVRFRVTKRALRDSVGEVGRKKRPIRSKWVELQRGCHRHQGWKLSRNCHPILFTVTAENL